MTLLRSALLISLIAVLSGCSCAITMVQMSAVRRPPPIEVFDRCAADSGFSSTRRDLERLSYSNGGLGMHFTPRDGKLEFVNSFCPVLPFWTKPGPAFTKRWDSMNRVLKTLDQNGYPYRDDLDKQLSR